MDVIDATHHHASMTSHIYNVAVTTVSSIWMNPAILAGLVGISLVLFTGLAGRIVMLCEDVLSTRIFGRHQ